MAQRHKDPNRAAAEEARRAGRAPARADQAELAAVASQVGNSELSQRVAEAGAVRDELLRFALARLSADRGAQLTELSVLRDHSKWYRDVSRSYERRPDPRRWHRPARLYRRAVLALCAGETARATQLIEAAIQAEIAAFDGLPDRVHAKLDGGVGRPSARPAAVLQAGAYPTCTPCKIPEQLDLADRILDLDPAAFRAEIRKGRRGGGAAWWQRADDEVDEESDT